MRVLSLSVMTPVMAAVFLASALSCGNENGPRNERTEQTSPPEADGRQGVADWPMFRGGPTLAGRVELAGELDAPARVWTYRAKDAIEGSAAIVNGTVFVGSMDGVLHAVRLADGKPLWERALGASITATPLVLGEALYIGDGFGVLHALAVADGKELWKYDTESEIHSSVNTDGTRLLFGAYDANLHCLEAATGKLVWKFSTEGQLHSTPAIAGGKTFVSGCDETFRVVDIESGKEEAAVEMGGYTAASPAAFADRVFVGTYACQVLAIDWRAARKVWAFENPERSFPFHATCAVSAERVVAAGRDKAVHCLDAATGKVVWKFTSRSRFDSSPVIAGRGVWVGCGDGNLYRIDLEQGPERMWSFTVGAPISASPAIAGGRLVIADEDGVVHCLEIATAPGERPRRGEPASAVNSEKAQ